MKTPLSLLRSYNEQNLKPKTSFLALYEDEIIAREMALLTAGKMIGPLSTRIELKPLSHATSSPSYLDVNQYFKAVGIESTTPFLLHLSSLPITFKEGDIRAWLPQKIISMMERNNSFLLQFASEHEKQEAYHFVINGIHFLRSHFQSISSNI